MKPTLTLELFSNSFSYSSYSLFMAVGAIAVFLITMLYIKRKRLPILKSLYFLIITAFSVPIGGRILNVLINYNYYLNNPEGMTTLRMTGFSLMGGLLLAGIVGYGLSRLLRLSPWKMADLVAPGLGIGLAFMRLGCYFNGCCFGIQASLPWAVRFPFESPAHKHYINIADSSSIFSINKLLSSPSVHPTQLYEMTGALIAAGAAAFLLSRGSKSGVASLSAAIIFLFTRFGNHFLRVHPSTNQIHPLFYPLIYSLLIVVLTVELIKRSDRNLW